MGLNIPDEIAVLGVDDDDLECMMATPPLSSVAIPAEQIGYEAAQLLDRIMSGEKVSKEPVVLPPIRVVTRQSTDTLAVDDPAVAAALVFIRQNIAENLSVAKIVAEVGIVRRELERKFRAPVGLFDRRGTAARESGKSQGTVVRYQIVDAKRGPLFGFP